MIEHPSTYRTLCEMVRYFFSRSRFTPYMTVEGRLPIIRDWQRSYTVYMLQLEPSRFPYQVSARTY